MTADITFQYPPELFNLLVDAPVLNKSKRDVLLFFQGAGVPADLTKDLSERLQTDAKSIGKGNPEWTHVYCAAVLAANTSMRGVEIKHLRRKDVDVSATALHIRKSKNEGSKRILPMNEAALGAVKMMIERADELGHTDPDHYLWCANQHHKLEPTKPGQKWDTAWRALRDAAGLRGLRFHDLRHTVVTRLLEAGEPDHVVESITGHLSRRMLEHYSHIRLTAKRAALDRLSQPRKARK